MRIYDITLTCDHRVLVWAPDAATAGDLARRCVTNHEDAKVKKADELDLGSPFILAVYPGPWSKDALVDIDVDVTMEATP